MFFGDKVISFGVAHLHLQMGAHAKTEVWRQGKHYRDCQNPRTVYVTISFSNTSGDGTLMKLDGRNLIGKMRK